MSRIDRNPAMMSRTISLMARMPGWLQFAMLMATGAVAAWAANLVPGNFKVPALLLVFIPPLWLLAPWSKRRVDQLAEVEPEPLAPSLLSMAPIPAGRFSMGSPKSDSDAFSDEQPAHEVLLGGFLLSSTPVTAAQYKFVDNNDDKPVVEVSWFDAVEYCNELSEREGLMPCYRIDGELVACDWQADGYRLPTEAEWEYACRAGTATPWLCEPEHLADYAWFDKNSNEQLQPVAMRKPNDFGLYDMAGNCWEWCWDVYDNAIYAERASKEIVHNPLSVNKIKGDRVIRGGTFISDARNLRSAVRRRDGPGDRVDFLGFRCVRVPSASR